MSKKRLLHFLLLVLGLSGMVLAVIQFIISVSFGELGRVLFYMVIALLCGELLAYAIFKLIKRS